MIGRDDEPSPDEIKAFLHHPLTQKLNRELMESFDRMVRERQREREAEKK